MINPDIAHLVTRHEAVVDSLFSPMGREVLRVDCNYCEPELLFLDLLDSDLLKGHSSKMIGNALLIWKR